MNSRWPSEEIMQQRRKDLSSARQRWQKHWAWVWQQKRAQTRPKSLHDEMMKECQKAGWI